MFSLAFIVMITIDYLFPLINISTESNQLTFELLVPFIIVATVIFFSFIFGWYIGKPLWFMALWISNLSKGQYEAPSIKQKIYNEKKQKWKRPYHLYDKVLLNISELSSRLKDSETRRKEIEALQKEWLEGVTHDLRTPLTYINGYAALLTSSPYDFTEEEKKQFLHEIEQKGGHIKELIDDLNLSFKLTEAKIPLQKEEKNMVELTRVLIADILSNPSKDQINLTLHAEKEVISFCYDTKLMYRALHNLINNAIIHNPEHTKITVTIQMDEHFHTVHIHIKDDGVGMDKKTLDKLFVKYYRGTTTDAEKEGSGLGMTIAQNIIKAHEGKVKAESKIGMGTTISITLPIEPTTYEMSS